MTDQNDAKPTLVQEMRAEAAAAQATAATAPAAAQPGPQNDSNEMLRLARLTESHARQTRNNTTFIAVVVGLWAVAVLIIGIIGAVQLSHLNSAFQNGGSPTPSSTCQSQGGFDPTC